ncbi:MAG TPA: hypothetical protein VHV10_01635 [Ktedonobacteraceae bacterium]|nr:hypothetical protein [Ktedonobacteraceae bacterium]
MKFRFLGRKNQVHHADGIPNSYYTYARDAVFDPGAEGLVYNNDIPHPLVDDFGGIRVGQLRLVEPQRVYQYLSLPTIPLIAGVQAGQIVTDPLLDPNNLPDTEQGHFLSQTLFGGVQ